MQATLAISALAFLWFTPAHPAAVANSDWQPMVGDRFIVDTTENAGYLIRSDSSSYTTFPVITGQRRVVHYIGRTYDARTPNQRWVVKTRHIKGDRITYGPTGRFLRMYKDGQEYTSYGIHEHRSEQRMFAENERYQSMGCIIVKTAIMDVVEATYELNGDLLEVLTQPSVNMSAWSSGSL